MVYATPTQDLAASYIAREITLAVASYDADQVFGLLQAPPNADIKLQSISIYGATSSSADYVQFSLIPPSAELQGPGYYLQGSTTVGSYKCIEGMGFGGASVPASNPLITFPTRNAMNMIIPAGWTLGVSWATAATVTEILGVSAVGIFDYTIQTLNFNRRAR
jgi:hypothetical protein